ncbi:tetratricopeptide repeat protein [Algibacillus agarilyticus]|uniref:tetratricopeptide repeat protein n=1 Tax=Algibacillus agarilyticus TaxID=2234133 RepID=UPI000DCFD225|nr:tetratricopeptide repeat protein [Algibacillus agarilyticus]
MSVSTTPKSKRFSFYVIAILLPFILLALFEISLRVVGYGKNIPLFIPAQGFAGYMQPNPNIIHRYFADPSIAPSVSPDTVLFKQQKPKDSFRIVVQGGSTAAGFPYGRWASLQGMLDQRFKLLYPNKNIEVINTAMAAVNTYTLLDFVEEIIEIQPDLILIYSGHNEYVGIMGIGSAFAAKGGYAATLIYLKLKSFKVYQWVESMYFKLFTSLNPMSDNKRSLMSKVAKEKNIGLNSALYQAGVEQFQNNLSLILAEYQTAKIPVMLSTLTSNEQDQTPFSTIGTTDWPQFINQQLPITSLTSLEAQVKNTPSAANYYQLGLKQFALNQFDLAQQSFQLAKDYDQLRFRAPSEFNHIIKKLSKEYHATLVDTDAFFRADSTHGIISNQHMLEHLHPNIRGYFLLAEAFVTALQTHNFIDEKPEKITTEQAWKHAPVSQVDQAYGQFKIDHLTSDYPFTTQVKKITPPTPNSFFNQKLVDRINGKDWLTIHTELMAHYQQTNNLSQASLIAGLLSDTLTNNHAAAYKAGQLYFKQKQLLQARFYYRKAIALAPEKINYQLNLAHCYFLLNEFELSESLLKNVLILDPDNTKAPYFLQHVQQAKRATNTLDPNTLDPNNDKNKG